MVSPKRAATFVAWGNAFLADAADPDTASEAVRAETSRTWSTACRGGLRR